MGDTRYVFDALVTATFEVDAPTLIEAAQKVRDIQEEDPGDLGGDVRLRTVAWGENLGAELVLVDEDGGNNTVLDRLGEMLPDDAELDLRNALAELDAVRAEDSSLDRIEALTEALNLALRRWPEIKR